MKSEIVKKQILTLMLLLFVISGNSFTETTSIEKALNLIFVDALQAGALITACACFWGMFII